MTGVLVRGIAVLLVWGLTAGGALAQVQFTDATTLAGVDGYTYDSPTSHSLGLNWIDYNRDGWDDLFLVRGGDPPVLYENNGLGGFNDVSGMLPALPTVEMSGSRFADVDGDGDDDIYIYTDNNFFCGGCDPSGPANLLLRNLWVENGNQAIAPLFEEIAAPAGVDDLAVVPNGGLPGHRAKTANFFDYDLDGCIDLFVGHTDRTDVNEPWLQDRLYRNLCVPGPYPTFEDTTASSLINDGTIPDLNRPVLGSFAGHLDAGIWPDLYVVNANVLHGSADTDVHRDLYYQNNGDDTFTESTGTTPGVGDPSIGDDAGAGMGIAVGDVDLDGNWDIYITDLPNNGLDATDGNVLMLGNGDGTFQDNSAIAAGVKSTSSWGTNFADVDHDGDEDLFVATMVGVQGDHLFLNDGTGSFQRDTSFMQAGPFGNRRGSAVADYDRDGDLDIAMVTNDGPLVLMRNDSVKQGPWLQVTLSTTCPNTNLNAIGAVVRVREGGAERMRQITGGSSAHSQNSQVSRDEVIVRWPGAGSETLTNVAVDGRINLVHGSIDPDTCLAGTDTDNDGLFDSEEIAVGTDPADADSDDDGVGDLIEVGSVSSPMDTDTDGTIDALDPDDDNDTVPTIAEDADGDGNPANDDADGDGIPDYRETDADDDGFTDDVDNCPAAANPSQSDVNGDGIGDACQPDDVDEDGWPNDDDNCPVVENPGQEDGDTNGFGDACEDTNSVARQWNDELLNAIRRDLARPTVHARNLYHVSAAMWDAWAAYDVAQQLLHLERATAVDVAAARAEAISFASYRILKARFANSPGVEWVNVSFDFKMDYLGYDKGFTSTVGNTAAALGNRIAATVLAFGLTDGANEQNGYANQYYMPVNEPLIMALPGNPDIADKNHWQPLALEFFIDQSGNPIPGGSGEFLSPEWGSVTPFALSPNDASFYNRDGFTYWVYHEADGPTLLGTPTAEDYLDGFEMVSLWSSHLDPSDGVMWDSSPAANGNAPLPDPSEWRDYYDFENGNDWGTGYPDGNPVTGEPYAEQWVPRADYARCLAEFWADGPDSETPPGHWFSVANYVMDNIAAKQIGGTGPVVDDLEWDVKLYVTLGGTMHDVAVAIWGWKGWYDYIRPVSALRAMAEAGQRSDAGLPSYHPEGFELRAGFIELITAASSAPGQRHYHLADYVDEVAIKAWRGPDFIADPDTDVAGVGWIRAKEWWPYQRPSFVTPPFAGFPSGHSAYSRAAAQVMDQFTGDPFFPGGMGEFHTPQNEFLVFEDGPSVDMTLQYATYYDASDQTSLSRIWGGIHPPVDDIVSRHVGAQIATDAYDYAMEIFSPAPCADGSDNDLDGFIDHDGGAWYNGGVPITAPDPTCQGSSWGEESVAAPRCGLGAELVLLLVPLAVILRRRSGERRDWRL
jgi:hypothetical protein